MKWDVFDTKKDEKIGSVNAITYDQAEDKAKRKFKKNRGSIAVFEQSFVNFMNKTAD